MCEVNRRPFDSALLLHQFPAPYTTHSLERAARALGIRVALKRFGVMKLSNQRSVAIALLQPVKRAATANSNSARGRVADRELPRTNPDASEILFQVGLHCVLLQQSRACKSGDRRMASWPKRRTASFH